MPSNLHPLIHELKRALPKPGTEWSTQDRLNWLATASSSFKIIYTDSQGGDVAIRQKHPRAGRTSAQ
jgi:hypothetical protein